MATPVRIIVAATCTVVVLLGAVGRTHAANQGITGKKLLLKSSKFVLLSKDPSITIAGSDAVGGSDSSVSFDMGGGPVPLALPKTLWGANGAGTLFKYKNPDAPSGPSVVKVAKVAGGLLKAVGKGAPFAVPNGAATINVVLSLDAGTNTYCMTFTGTGDGNKFLVKDAAAGTCPAACTGQLVGGFCWFLGAPADSCDATCTNQGLVCSVGTIAYAGTGGSYDQCVAVMTALGVTGNQLGDVYNGAGIGCLDNSDSDIARDTSPTTCSGAVVTIRRACACDGGGAFCGNNVRESTEVCDGTDATACPGQCQADCTCPPVCGNNVREGSEACDGTDDAACPGQCRGDCTCPGMCTTDDAALCNNLALPICGNCCSQSAACTLDCSAVFPTCSATDSQTCATSIRLACASACCP